MENQKGVRNNKLSAGALVLVSLAIVVGAAWADMFQLQLKGGSKILTSVGLITPTPTPLPEPTYDNLSAMVVPAEGYTVPIKWGDVGKKLIESGAIDMDKYRENYSDAQYAELLSYLTENKDKGITINKDNAYFWVNTLWALGLVQNSDVLDKGIMGTEYREDLGNFASTAGWTLGTKKAIDLYSSEKIVDLSPEEQALVAKISGGIYRPCCGNPTSFPDCNHGMAILGLVELMVDQGFSEEEIYEASLAFNSYWFEQTYVDLAYFFQTEEGTLWTDVDAAKVLSAKYSSAPGYQEIKQQLGNVPGSKSSGSSCGA